MQTVSWAGSTYNIPNQRGDTPWSGLSDFAVAVASKGINTGGGNFTLLADVNFGATFGLVSTYFKSRTANIATAGALRLASADSIQWRNNANGANILLEKDTSDNLKYNSTKVLLSGAVVNADINAAAAIAYSKLNLSASIVNADVGAAAAIAYSKLAALTASRALVSNGSGVVTVATTTATEIGYVNGVTSAIQTQLDGKASASGVVLTTTDQTASGVKTFSGQLIGKGTATNDDAAAGYIGEYIESKGTNVGAAATGVWKDLTSISLTAGDWDVTVSGCCQGNGATVTGTNIGIGTVTGDSDPGTVGQDKQAVANPTATQVSGELSNWRIKLASTTTVYGKIMSTFSVATPNWNGFKLHARRRR